MRRLRIGVPSKGRLAELANSLLTQAGLRFRRQDRSLFARVKGMDVDITFLRTDDIPILCSEGAIDLGITGSDLVLESRADVIERMQLGVGKCRLAICVPEDSPATKPADLQGLRIATSFPNATDKYLQSHGTTARTVKLSGSVEVMVALGVADAIVDLVETGSTLVANRLRILDEIGEYETVFIQSRQCSDQALADRIIRRLEGVTIARDYSLLEYNVPRDQLSRAKDITPGFNSPTVSTLEDENWCSVRAMVKKGELIAVMEQLEKIGAHAILETVIANCRL